MEAEVSHRRVVPGTRLARSYPPPMAPCDGWLTSGLYHHRRRPDHKPRPAGPGRPAARGRWDVIRALARIAFPRLARLYVGSLLIQVFLAGLAVFNDPASTSISGGSRWAS
jgi:hypothetical protein